MKIFGSLIAGMLLFVSLQAGAQPHPVPALSGDDNTHYSWADVLRVDPVFDTAAAAATPAQTECWEEQVPVGDADREERQGRRTAATVFGAIIGGLLGNRIGKGHGRQAATAAGAVAGGVIGNNIAAEGERDDGPRYTIQRHCREAGASQPRRVVGYDVEYRYRGDVYTSRLPHDPGNRLRVRVSVTPAE
ncbi:MAG: glycine zipper 2TM domain-containing protein [Rudaea sp.]